MTALIKKQTHRLGPQGEGCWAFDNTDDASRVSGKFYGLVVPDQHKAKMHELSHCEETAFWTLNFEVGREALERLNRATGETHALLLGVNDGYYVGQSIPHIHSHIVVTEHTPGVEEFFMLHDMARAFDHLRRAFSPATNPPMERRRVSCDLRNLSEFTEKLYYARRALQEKGMDMFRFYTGSPFCADFKQISFVIDACDSQHPMFSFSQAWRAMNNRMAYEKLQTPLGRAKYTHFEPAPEAP